jgi:hypothetical protein
MAGGLHQQIADFQQWREQLSQTISEYRQWLETTNSSDSLQDLRLFDMMETLRKDHLVLAFVAEFSRGKTETINALFFADYNQRLLPSEAGRTTMCPTEIFWDEREEPCIKLLPIETRKRDDSLAYLKSNPNEWTTLRLDIHSAEAMKESMHSVIQQKSVSMEEARSLGLWNENDVSMVQSVKTRGVVDVPVWRHALINFPHPLLKSGLVILDTPGLNTLGSEPELTLSIIPNAHAVIFLLATDTGVTKSDMQIWSDFIRTRASRKLAILNKIDILWDEMKTEHEIKSSIQSQINSTAQHLGLPPSCVLAISAQKALLAKIRKDAALLKKSGIAKVEHLLAESVVGSKHEILSKTIIAETSNMLRASRKVAQQRLEDLKAQLKELDGLKGQNRMVIQSMLSKVTEERKHYEASVITFNKAEQQIGGLGQVLLNQLSLQNLDALLQVSKAEIGESWTTLGLTRGMKDLMQRTSDLASLIIEQASQIKGTADEIYKLFHEQHGFPERKPPALQMEHFMNNMQALQKATQEFCASPVNVMTEKHFLIRRFFINLGGQAQIVFQQAHTDCQNWIRDVFGPLRQQISDHKIALEKRSNSLMNIHENQHVLEVNLAELEKQLNTAHQQSSDLDQMLLRLIKAAKPLAQPSEVIS